MGVSKTVLVAGLAVVAVMAGAGLGLLGRAEPSATILTLAPDPSAAGAPTVDVHVAGWVVRPGVVVVGEGSIVADAIEAAGGLREGARSDLINLAAPLVAGQQVIVPGPEGSDSAVSPNEGLISLNLAGPSDLEKLPGVGPVLAERIVAHRDTQGPFQTVDDLLDVPGIGEAKLASIRDLVRP